MKETLFLTILLISNQHYFLFFVSAKSCLEGEWPCDNECFVHQYICDGYQQCSDASDEGELPGQGCNLYPESGCPSSDGRRHFKCQRTGFCYASKEEAASCEEADETKPPSRECLWGDSEKGWMCGDGRCIIKSQVCDGFPHCKDKSDEGIAPYEGCNSHPDVDSDCVSWFGELHRECQLGNPDIKICTLDYLAKSGNIEECRRCPDDPGFWRCNDGRCINSTFIRNGRRDCSDGSDEDAQITLGLSLLITATLSTVLFGLSISFSCRALRTRNPWSYFHCEHCQQSDLSDLLSRYQSQILSDFGSKKRINLTHKRESSKCAIITKEEDDLIPNDDIPSRLIILLENKADNWDMRRRNKILAKMTGGRESVTALKSEVVTSAKGEYVLVHNDSIQYHHLYMYFANRCGSVKELAKITKHLFSWEMELHQNDKLEVLKCWRLHLGNSSLTSQIIDSVCENPSFYARCGATFYPLRQFFNVMRKKIWINKPAAESNVEKIMSLLYCTLVPFVAGVLFYFEQIKNIVLALLLWSAVMDYSDMKPEELPFEFSLCLLLLLSIVLTHLLFIFYTYSFAEQIFELSHQEKCSQYALKSLCCKTFSILLTPLVPSFILANYVYYDSKVSRVKHQLQTVNDSMAEDLSDSDIRQRQINHMDRVKLYRFIVKLQDRRHMYRKLYSHYRVTSALIESVSVIIVIVLLMLTSKNFSKNLRNNYKQNSLIDLLEHRMAAFLGVNLYGDGIKEGLIHSLLGDAVMLTSICYSFLVIQSALVKYWHQAKNVSLTWMGQTVLGIYVGLLMLNKLTTSISLLSSSMKLTYVTSSTSPKMCLALSFLFIIILVFLRIALVFIYKKKFSRNWNSGDRMDQWINVLLNTYVIIPFSSSISPVEELKVKQSHLLSADGILRRRSDPATRREEILKVTSPRNVGQKDGSGSFNATFLEETVIEDAVIRKLILELWWSNPYQRLRYHDAKEYVIKKLKKSKQNSDFINEELNFRINENLTSLQVAGLVNTALLASAPTRHEYFFLFILVVIENIISVGVEVYAGGFETGDNEVYYSWDIRLYFLGLALVFLVAYYCKYHTTGDLFGISCNSCCCFGSSTTLTAPSHDAMQNILVQEEAERKRKPLNVAVETQTSFRCGDSKRFFLGNYEKGNLCEKSNLIEV